MSSGCSQNRIEGVDDALAELLRIPDEAAVDEVWTEAFAQARTFIQRPSKRFRPGLALLGYSLARPSEPPPDHVVRFAAALELLHAFMLIHDDVADRSPMRRGGPAFHVMVADERLASVVGDHLFARAVEGMLTSGDPQTVRTTQYMLGICRHTAVGQYLDLALSRTPLREVTLWQTLRVAGLKTARYGFVAPLVSGAMLGGASEALMEVLRRAGRHAGIAFQLRDDLLGLFGSQNVTGKPGDADFVEGKRTFPLIAAFSRADSVSKERMSELWDARRKHPQMLAEARQLVDGHGGRRATERVIARSTSAALRALSALPVSGPRSSLERTLHSLSHPV